MIRSTSKLLKKGSSVRNINKAGSKFRFVVEFETATKILAGGDVVVTWERKGVVLSTDPIKVSKSTRSADFSGQKLSQVVTLFKPKKSGLQFDEKAYLLQLRSGNDKGKVIGRIYLNFAEYVEIPEFSKRMVAKLSHDGELVMRITSTYLGEAKKKRSSQGSSSVSSFTTTGDRRDTITAADNDQSDLSDLNVPDFDDSEPASSRVISEKKLTKSQSRRDRDRPRGHNRSASQSGSIIAPSPSRRREREREREKERERERERERESKRHSMAPTVSTVDDLGSSRREKNTSSITESSGSGGRPTVPRADFEKLKRDNRALVRQNKDLQAQNDELEDKLSSAGLNAASGKVDMLEDELERLRKEVRDLKGRLSREPVYADVVRELKDAKMALAILSTENAELKSRRR